MTTSLLDTRVTDVTGTVTRGGVSRAALAWGAVALVATAAGALIVVNGPAARAPEIRWWHIWLVGAGRGLLLTFSLYVIFRVTERFPIGRAHLRHRVSVHALTACALAGLSTANQYWLERVTLLWNTKMPPAGWRFFFAELLGYVLLAALAHGLVYARRYWDLRTTSHRLRNELAEAGRRRASAELRALKAEINPHFLGNALEAVSGLIRTDAAEAQRVLAELGSLLRGALARAQTQEVALSEELETLEPFLDLERARLGWRFGVELDVAEDALGALVPDMILQPMVEHAVRRGLARRTAGCIRISARRHGTSGELLELHVADEGAGEEVPSTVPLAPTTAAGWVTNARARLAELYGRDASLELTSRPGVSTGSVAARLTVPWREPDLDAEVPAPTGTATTPDALADALEGGRVAWHRRVPLVPIAALLVFSVWFTFAYLKRPLAQGSFTPMPLHHAIQFGILEAAIAVAIGWTAFRLTRRYPPVALGAVTVAGRQVLMAHAKAALALGIAGAALSLGNSWVLGYLFPSVDQIRVVKAVTSTVGLTASYTLMYGFLAVLAYGIEYARRYRQARTGARRLSAELNEVGRRRAVAELCALKAELNPHFLGNALHTVSALARVNPDAAERVLAQLGELLRTAVTHSRTHEVPLREELETLEPFLAVAQARLGRRLEVDWDVDDTLLDARVPHMILQPLVENAVKHGLSPQECAGHIAVIARKDNNRLELSVRDDGVGLPQSTGHSCAFERCGVGLANTRARLAEMYGSAATLELMSGDRGGTVARLSLPWRDTATPFAMGL